MSESASGAPLHSSPTLQVPRPPGCADEAPPPLLPDVQVLLGRIEDLDRGERLMLLQTHQRRSWQQGHLVLVENYVDEIPELRNDQDAILDLLTNEILLRQERGDQLELDEYVQRFPQHERAIHRILALSGMVSHALRRGAGGSRSVSVENDALTLPPRLALPDDLGSESSTVPPPQTGAAKPERSRAAVAGYEILGELGRGGMGVVYKARQVKLNRLVALKMVLAGAHAGPEDLARFRSEAEAVAKLQHPNIVPIYEIDEQDGCPCYSMEYAEGGSLANHLDGTPIASRPAARFIETLARAIEAAHSQEIVHRDLKPANVLLKEVQCPSAMPDTPDDESAPLPLDSRFWTPKITDFGLAKRLAEGPGSGKDWRTHSGAVLGTPSYMAPEQAGGKTEEIGRATDIYALGAILYELLTGRPPFRAARPLDTVLQVLNEEPVAPSRLNGRVPRDLETICLKCLEKQPHKRYATAGALADDLRAFLDARPIMARPVPFWERGMKWARRRPASAILLALAVLALVGAFMAMSLRLVRQTQIYATAQEQAYRDVYFSQIDAAATRWNSNHPDEALDALDAAAQALQLPQGQRPWEWAYLNHLLHENLTVAQASGANLVVASSGDRCATANPETASVVVCDLASGHRQFSIEHAGPGIAFSPNGRTLAVATWDVSSSLEADLHRPSAIKLYGAMGEELDTLPGQSGAIWSLAFTPNGHVLASAGVDHQIKLWDMDHKKELRTLNGHGDWVQRVMFSPDGAHLASTSADDTVKVWEVGTGNEILSLNAGNPEARLRRSKALDGIDRQDEKIGRRFAIRRRLDQMHAVAFSPDGHLLAFGRGNRVVLWDWANRRERLGLPTHSAVRSLAFSPDGSRIVAGNADRSIRLWQVSTGLELGAYRGHIDPVNAVAFAADGSQLVSLGLDRLCVWPGHGPAGIAVLQDREELAAPVALNPLGDQVAAASGDGEITVWSSSDGQKQFQLKGHRQRVTSLAFRADGKLLASGAQDQSIKLWDMATGKAVNRLEGHEGAITSLAFGPDGGRLISAAEDLSVRIWDLNTGKLLHPSRRFPARILSLAFTSDARLIALGGDDGFLAIWDPVLQEVAVCSGHSGEIRSLAFSRDGQLLASASLDGTVRIWETATHQEVRVLHGHTDVVLSVAFLEDSQTSTISGEPKTIQRLASAGADRRIILWEPRSGRQILSLDGHPAPVLALAFEGGGRRLVSVDRDGCVHIWDGTVATEGADTATTPVPRRDYSMHGM